jgi:hypothetical protein
MSAAAARHAVEDTTSAAIATLLARWSILPFWLWMHNRYAVAVTVTAKNKRNRQLSKIPTNSRYF